MLSYGCLIGVSSATLSGWLSDEGRRLNSARYEILAKIQENHRMQHISLLNDSVVGQIAVANNDIETGLKWSENNQTTITKQAVYLLPSERIERLRLDIKDDQKVE